MAHRFKAPKIVGTYLPKRAHHAHGVTIKQELDLRRMARLIRSESQLQAILAQTRPELRVACLDRIRGFLGFKLRPDFLLAEQAETMVR